MSKTVNWMPGMTLEQMERQVIEAEYEFRRRDKSATAAALACTVRTLDNKFAKWKEEKKEQDKAEAQRQKDRADFNLRARGLHPSQLPALVERSVELTDAEVLPVEDPTPEQLAAEQDLQVTNFRLKRSR